MDVVAVEELAEAAWRSRAARHAARVEVLVAPHLARRAAGVKHPVHDFLFTYYSQRPAQLRRWHPGFGVRLGGDASAYEGLKGYAGGAVTTAYVDSQRPLIASLHALLSATAARPAALGCFGMHEWAMTYRVAEDETRHASHPLRLGPAGTDAVVESHRISCSHFDAFRFFTEPARALNLLSPGPGDRASYEQPGCLHAGMDLYKHAFRLTPMICSDLVADAFELAWDIRILDMRAAPYDFSGVILDSGVAWTPVRIETTEGKAEYVAAQRALADRGAPIRARLIAEGERLLG